MYLNDKGHRLYKIFLGFFGISKKPSRLEQEVFAKPLTEDEDFFANPKWVKGVVEIFNKRDLHKKYGVEFDTFASINDLYNLEKRGEGAFLDEMKQAGFNSFTIGVESLNPEILRSYNKELMILPTMEKNEQEIYKSLSKGNKDDMLVKHYLSKTQNAINFAQDHKILIVGDYIFGNMEESQEDGAKGFEKFSGLENLHLAYLPIFTPFPGTGLWEEAYNSGKLIRTAEGKIDWSKFDASAGALDLGYDIEGLRNSSELDFYTSERYQRDMKTEIEQHPETIGMFKSRFNYLANLFPEDERVQGILKQKGF